MDPCVVSDELAETAGIIYLALVDFVEEYSLDWGREKIPSLIQFLQACERGHSIAPLFLISERQLEAVIGPVGIYNLGELRTTKPLLVVRA
ncbi:MAG: hypothetical protein V1704_05000 [Candidatus Vogelbacteria bacterium]